jgi:long-chain acyl-CoA synthetase
MNIKLQEKYLEHCNLKGIEYFTMYGQTEATARMSYLPYQFANQKKGSIGIAIPGGRFELRDETDQKIEGINTIGELVYFGQNVSLGYATCYNDLLKEDENKGMLYTGDLAKRDDEGFYYIVGRKNRFLKLFGNRISLQEIEEQLESRGIEAVCGGQDDKLIAYITNKEEVDQVRKWLSEFTRIHLSAFEVKFIKTIPRNESGKILYSKLFL